MTKTPAVAKTGKKIGIAAADWIKTVVMGGGSIEAYSILLAEAGFPFPYFGADLVELADTLRGLGG
jgi:hypothetical protein